QQGLVRQDAHSARPGSLLLHQPLLPAESSPEPVWPNPLTEPMFWEIMRLRKEMSLAKLGFFPQEA
ncbi:RAB3IL1 isoform 7, partial [Pongo abelii]